MTSPDSSSDHPGVSTAPTSVTASDALAQEVLQSDSPATGPEALALAGSAQLAELVSAAVAATRGVVRIEPTLKNSIVRLATAAHQVVAGITRTTGQPDRYLAVDGVSVVIRDDQTDVGVDIVVDTIQPARTTAHAARATITHTLEQAGLTPGRTTVTILAVEASNET